MKRYIITGADAMTHIPAHPERTARRSAAGFLNFDVIYQEWPNRASMLRTVDMQENAGTQNRWKACKV